ncbi:Wzz/FepE/Etk N-terminal domain-containing protein [Pseudomonas putida]|uniref:Wzz/FepE/Etk N-terminal domain-containing protein n=1 Tax=Pseudomonas putida TaxID=303 RepID=UPI002364A2D3|nr:Wzz/FepE/Etk N-terminal domain-containing protein [Pseudomonas putida]MDD1965646.1 Wzz/FepE/Etk N-terminal domain-containing protein [Pseudomonas putida]
MANSSSTEKTTDEIDVMEVLTVLWQQKVLVLAAVVVCTLIAAAYVSQIKPVYEARGYLLPPTNDDIKEMNKGRGEELSLKPFTDKDMYDVYTRELQAEATRKAVFDRVVLPANAAAANGESREAAYERFLKSVTVSPVGAELDKRFAITVQGQDPAQAAAVIKAMIFEAQEVAVPEVIAWSGRQTTVALADISRDIAHLREIESETREDEITRLQEALSVAQAMGLENPAPVSASGKAQVDALVNDKLSYMRGTKALAAQIQVLSERKSGDPFIPNLRTLQMKERFIDNLQINPERVRLYRLDGSIDVPTQPMSSRKRLILAMGVLGGAGLGVFLALARYFLMGRRKIS